MPLVHFDWTISLGQIVQAVSFVLAIILSIQRVYHLLDKRIALIVEEVKQHGATLSDHNGRMTKYEEMLFKVVGDLQRLVGRAEVQLAERSGGDRRHHTN